jgi:pheromone a factor receptor
MSVLPTWAYLVIITIPQIILEFVSGVYGCLSIHAFYNRSRMNESHNINPDRYIRLICFSTVDLLCGIPITVFHLIAYVLELIPNHGFKQEQYEISLIYQLPAAVWRADVLTELKFELVRWIILWDAIVFFAIFGFTKESLNNYRAMLHFVAQVFVKITGIKSRPTSSNKAEGCVKSLFFLFFV